MKVAIINYGMGNVASVQKALNKIGYESTVTNDHNEIKKSNIILLPGVGSFSKGMENLHKLHLIELLNEEVIKKNKPFIGICLGMQLLATYGNEPVKSEGLGWIRGDVVNIESDNGLRIPHLGWNSVNVKNKVDFYNEFNKKDFYFIHSYHFRASKPEEVTLTVTYGNELVAGIQKRNIYGLQFHPEKSQKVGIKLLKKILDQHA